MALGWEMAVYIDLKVEEGWGAGHHGAVTL